MEQDGFVSELVVDGLTVMDLEVAVTSETDEDKSFSKTNPDPSNILYLWFIS